MRPSASPPTLAPAAAPRALSLATCTALALTTLAIGPASLFAFSTEEFILLKSAALAASAFVCALLLAREIYRRGAELDAVDGIVVLYFAWGAIAWAASGGPTFNLFDWLGREAGPALVFFAVAFAVTRSGGRSHERVIVALALVVAAIGLAEARGAGFPFHASRRPGSLLGNRNFVGAYLAIALPFAFARAFKERSLRHLLAVAVLTTAVLLTRCRSAWVGLLLAGALSAVSLRLQGSTWSRDGARRIALVALAAAVGVAGTRLPWPGLHWSEPSPLSATAARLVDYQEGSGHVRVLQAETAVAVARAMPLGAGPGGWDDAESRLRWPQEWRVNPTPASDFARILAEFGVVGAALVVGAVGVVLVWGARAALAAGSVVSVTPLAAMTVAMVHSLLDAPLFRAPLAVLLATVAGMLRGSLPSHSLVALRSAGARRGVSAAIVAFGILGLVSPLLLIIAGLSTPPGSTVETFAAAQALYPREYAAEYLAKVLVHDHRCADAAPELARLHAWTPHHLGPYRLELDCAKQTGDMARAEALAAKVEELTKMREHSAAH